MPPTSKNAAFWSKQSRKYAASPISNMDGYLATLERTKSYLKSEDRALEIGCGTGSTAMLLAPHVAHITGTDIAPGMIEIAREKLTAEGPDNVTFNVSEILDHHSDEGGFDVVLAHNLLHLVDELDIALAHISTLVKPGGLFISKTPCTPQQAGVKFWLIRRVGIPLMQAVGKAPYVQFMTSQELDRKITSAGFDIVETADQHGMILSRYLVARKI